MAKNNQENKENRKEEYSATNSVSAENQNQSHNTKKQSLGPNTKR